MLQRLCFELFFVCQEACKLGTAFMKLQGEHESLKKKHAEDNGKVMFPVADEEIKFFHHVTFLVTKLAEAAKKAFEAKVKESDEFVNKMKKEIEQAEKCAKEKKALEKQVAIHKKTIEENEAAISKLQSDLQKLSKLRSKEKENHEVELAATRESVKNAEEYCAGRFASFSEMLSSKMSSLYCASDLLLSCHLVLFLHHCCLYSLFHQS